MSARSRESQSSVQRDLVDWKPPQEEQIKNAAAASEWQSNTETTAETTLLPPFVSVTPTLLFFRYNELILLQKTSFMRRKT